MYKMYALHSTHAIIPATVHTSDSVQLHKQGWKLVLHAQRDAVHSWLVLTWIEDSWLQCRWESSFHMTPMRFPSDLAILPTNHSLQLHECPTFVNDTHGKHYYKSLEHRESDRSH